MLVTVREHRAPMAAIKKESILPFVIASNGVVKEVIGCKDGSVGIFKRSEILERARQQRGRRTLSLGFCFCKNLSAEIRFSRSW